jgi:hypothetical protein
VKKPGENSDVCNATYEVDCIVDRPVAEVRKKFVDMSSWVISHTTENIYGTLDSERAVA